MSTFAAFWLTNKGGNLLKALYVERDSNPKSPLQQGVKALEKGNGKRRQGRS